MKNNVLSIYSKHRKQSYWLWNLKWFYSYCKIILKPFRNHIQYNKMHIIVTYLVKDRQISVLLYRKTQLRVNSYHKVKLQNWRSYHTSLKPGDLIRQSRDLWRCFILKRKEGQYLNTVESLVQKNHLAYHLFTNKICREIINIWILNSM